jgi:hypothetical protein
VEGTRAVDEMPQRLEKQSGLMSTDCEGEFAATSREPFASRPPAKSCGCELLL